MHVSVTPSSAVSSSSLTDFSHLDGTGFQDLVSVSTIITRQRKKTQVEMENNDREKVNTSDFLNRLLYL